MATDNQDGFSRDFPQYLSAPFQILFWEADDMGVIMIFLAFALSSGGWWWVMLLIGPYIYSSIKKNRPRGYLRHLLYMAGLVELKGYPSYWEQEFRE